MTRRLTRDARDTLKNRGITQAAWIRRHFGDDATTWHGDVCGCPDDQCVGYHHDELDECECLPTLLDRYPEEVPSGR